MKELTQEIVRELFDYDATTGLVVWRFREDKWFDVEASRPASHTAKIWNNRYAGKSFGSKRKKDGYLETKIFDKLYKVHRLIWLWVYGEWPKFEIDHINGVRFDNRLSNLRDVTHKVNMMNQKFHRNKNQTSD